MRDDVLRVLEHFGKIPDHDGHLRLYHATDATSAALIVREGVLRAMQADDPAARMLERGVGSVYLSSSPAIGDDLGNPVVLAVDVDAACPSAEVLREGFSEPPRVELEVHLPAGGHLTLVTVDRLDREVEIAELPPAARDAIALFRDSPVGQRLKDPAGVPRLDEHRTGV